MLSTGIRVPHRSMGNSAPGPGPGQAHPTPEGMAVAQDREAAADLKPATSAVVGAVTALLVALTGAEVSVRRAIEARRAAVLLPGAVGGPAAVVVGLAAEEAPVAAEVVAAAVAAAAEVDVGKQEREETRETVMKAKGGSLDTNG